MKLKQGLLCFSGILMIMLLIVQECDAIRSFKLKGGSSRRGKTQSGSSGNGGSWWSRVTGGGSSSASSASKVSSSSASHKKPPEPSAPRLEQAKPIGWNVPGNNNPGAPPAYSNTHTRGLSNPSGLANPPPYSKNNLPGHQTIHSNTANQYQGMNYPRNTGGSYPNQGGQYSGVNYGGGGHYPGPSYGGGGHYPGMNYGAGSHSGYSGYSGYSAAAPSGYFASGYPAVNNYYSQQRSSSGGTLTNALLAGSLGLGLYNAIRPYPSYSGGGSGGSTVHHHYYNNQADPNANVAQAIPSNQNTNAAQPAVTQNVPQTAVAQNGPQPAVAQNVAQPAAAPQVPVGQTGIADPSAALVTPPPPTLAPNDQISDLDCVYAMKILNCSDIKLCPQEWLHPACLNRTISKEYYDSITLPPPPPMPQLQPDVNATKSEMDTLPSNQIRASQNQQQDQNRSIYSASGQQSPVLSSASTTVNFSLFLTIFSAGYTLSVYCN